jgi:formamidopyrimidine-DNA glycosylase
VPELPEVETIARDLDGAVRGATITAVYVHRADVLRECTARTLGLRLRRTTFERFWRRGKFAIADLSTGDKLVVSPRFTGALLVEAGAFRRSAADHTAIQFRLGDGRTLRYRDVRRLGTVSLMTAERFTEWVRRLGPEPTDISPAAFAQVVRSSSRAIKTILMDQRRIAGIGNIYANEALWRARIRPSRRGRTLTRAETALLLDEARAARHEFPRLPRPAGWPRGVPRAGEGVFARRRALREVRDHAPRDPRDREPHNRVVHALPALNGVRCPRGAPPV